MGLEGIVSKRKDSVYRSGRSPDWLKMKNPEALAVKREAEEAAKINGGNGCRQKPAHALFLIRGLNLALLSGRSSTYRPVQISEAGSEFQLC